MDTTASSELASSTQSRRGALLAEVAVRLAGAWLLTGALFKLFLGNPKLLPELVRDHSPFTWTLTFQLAIAIELVIVSFAMLRPRIGWMAITGLFSFFLVILVDQQMKGAESCGCLGETIKMPPLVMMAIDGTLLAFVLATRPWSTLSSRGAPIAVLGLALVVSIAAPWVVIRTDSGPTTPPHVGPSDGTATTTPGNGAVPIGSGPVVTGRVWIDLSPESWTGQTIFDIAQLTRWVPVDQIPSDGKIVFWRQSCDHCAKHLQEMANQEQTLPVLLVQVMDDLKASRAVEAMPTGASVTQFALPSGAEGNFTTPFEVRVEGGVVKAVLYEKDFEAERSK